MAMAKPKKIKLKKPQPDPKQKLFWQVLIIVLVVIVLISIALTAFFTSEIAFRSTLSGENQSKGLSSMLDAKLVCDQKVKDKYDKVLQSSTLNRLSSRYDDNYGGYKLYYNVSVYRDAHRKSGTKDLMYRCHIYNDGDVSDTGIIRTTPSTAKTSRKDNGNPFGFK